MESVVDPEVVLGSLGQVVSGSWWPSNVRNYRMPDVGSWHPDGL